MDERRLDTGQILASGILSKPTPNSNVPADANLKDVGNDWSEESVREGLGSGGIKASMYYGCWSIWKAHESFSGELMQYRSITDHFEDVSFDVALEKALFWAEECNG